MDRERPITDLADDQKSSVRLLGRNSTMEQAWKLMTNDDVSAVGLLDFVGDRSARDVSRRLASLGSDAEMSFYYIGDPDKSKTQLSFRDEITKDFQEYMQMSEEAGIAGVSEGLAALLPHVQAVISRMVELYDTNLGLVCYDHADMCFLLKIEINIPGACIKLHCDSIGVRFVTSMTGGGTVVADGEALDWDAWKACDGLLPLSMMKEDQWLSAIKKFNAGLCPAPRQLQYRDFDLLMIKGDATGAQPCIHRAPLSAGDESVERILVKLDFIPRTDVEKYVQLIADSDTE